MSAPSLLLLAALAASPADRFLAEESVAAAELPSVPAKADDPAWAKVKPATVLAHPQRTVKLLDRDVNAALPARTATPVEVRAAYDRQSLAVLLTWTDATESRIAGDEVTRFGDAAALEVPARFGAGRRLPYVGMGDEQEHVLVYLQRAVEGGAAASDHVAAGFGSLTRTGPRGTKNDLRYDARTGRWKALFVRPLVAGDHSVAQGLVPFALAIWDGAHKERGGNKSLSGWKFLRLGRWPVAPAYLAEQAFGYGPGEAGDPAKGKVLVESVCIACHHVGDKKFAPPGFAPDLSSIGAISTYGYLRDSLLAPSEVVVPHGNPNRHQDRSKPRDPNGAYPSSPVYEWSMLDPSGKKVSKMAPFTAFSKEDFAGVLAYLKSLGAAAPATRGASR